MARRLQQKYSQYFDMRFGFANTSEEDERTLIFVDRCDREWGLNLVWLEAVTHPGERKGATHRIVDFASAARDGSVFEDMIKKYGIPNRAYPHCNRELKLNPIRSYLDSIGWGDCLSAVGLRADEPGRFSKKAAAQRIVYPAAHWFPTTKPDVMEYWEDMPFDLGLRDHEGNCKWCWKKVLSKLVRQAHERPEVFDFPLRMEAEYPLAGHNVDGTPRTFFRENRSALDILHIASTSDRIYPPERPDDSGGCSESCEAFTE